MNIDDLLRKNIREIVPYSTARDEFKGGKVSIFLDANENPYDTVLNRYPDPKQIDLKKKIIGNRNLTIDNLFLGNGSDEVIDLIIRAFCIPGKDKIMIHPPTYGMYQVAAATNDNEVVKVNLTPDFELDVEEILTQAKNNVKVFFICSPNNPTGNIFRVEDIERLFKEMNAIIVIDEAYINFSDKPSWTERLDEFPNLVVMQTLSKAWGMAGIRLGQGYASKRIVEVLNKIKLPYNLNTLTQEAAIKALDNISEYKEKVVTIKKERAKLFGELEKLAIVQRVYPSEANYILCKFKDADATYNYLVENGIIVRNRSNQPNCENCLRITVGTPEDNETLIKFLKEYANKSH